MKLIYKTSSTEFIALARIAFDREGIEHFIPEGNPSTFGLGASITVGHSLYILHEEDEEQALEVLRELGAFETRARAPVAPRKLPTWLVIAASVLAVVAMGAALGSK